MNKILSKIEERFNKLEEENKRLRKMIDEMRPAKSKFM
jgi:predicted nuclease with TOPRIM domain